VQGKRCRVLHGCTAQSQNVGLAREEMVTNENTFCFLRWHSAQDVTIRALFDDEWPSMIGITQPLELANDMDAVLAQY
jgi:hypothetical protein